jgi:hypothetical protein
MKVTITHKHIFDAIKFNHLVADRWFEPKEVRFEDKDDKFYKANCTACLVGSTVRRAAPKNTSINSLKCLISTTVMTNGVNIIGMKETPEYIASCGQYLTALSAKFESTVRNKAALKYKRQARLLDSVEIRNTKLSAKEKKDLADWVKLYIPKSFEIGEDE